METGIRAAKNNLSKLVEAVIEGEQVFLTNRGKRVAQLVAVKESAPGGRGRGFLKEKINLYPGWDSQEEDIKIEQMFDAIAE